jgi:hypothetical protein
MVLLSGWLWFDSEAKLWGVGGGYIAVLVTMRFGEGFDGFYLELGKQNYAVFYTEC